MEHIIQNTDKLSSGAFIINANKSPFRPFDISSPFYLTQEGNDSLKREVLKIIYESKSVLKICSFILTDKDIFEAILNKIHTSSIAVFILTQLDQEKLKDPNLLAESITEEEIKNDTGKIHLGYIAALYQHGAHVRASKTAHAKFIVSDRNLAFLTSANLTTPSLSINTESGIYLNANDSSMLDKLFDTIFQLGTNYNQYININRRRTLVVQGTVSLEARHLPAHQLSNLRYTYEDLTNNLYHEILDIIKQANEYLLISTFSIVALERLPEFVNEIENALKKGVRITFFCRGMNHRIDHLQSCHKLSSIGCNLYADGYNHSKGIVSEKKGLIFTANIDGNHGLKNGFEVGCVLENNERTAFVDLHKYFIETSPYKFEASPPRIDLFNTYLIHEKLRGIIPPAFPKEIIITLEGRIQNYLPEFLNKPIFLGDQDNMKYLIIGNFHFITTHNNLGHFRTVELGKPRFGMVKYLIKYNTLKIIVNQ